MAGVKLLSESNIFKQAVADLNNSIPAKVQSAIPTAIVAFMEALPNEANNDPIPAAGKGLYISGQGNVKVA